MKPKKQFLKFLMKISSNLVIKIINNQNKKITNKFIYIYICINFSTTLYFSYFTSDIFTNVRILYIKNGLECAKMILIFQKPYYESKWFNMRLYKNSCCNKNWHKVFCFNILGINWDGNEMDPNFLTKLRLKLRLYREICNYPFLKLFVFFCQKIF